MALDLDLALATAMPMALVSAKGAAVDLTSDRGLDAAASSAAATAADEVASGAET